MHSIQSLKQENQKVAGSASEINMNIEVLHRNLKELIVISESESEPESIAGATLF